MNLAMAIVHPAIIVVLVFGSLFEVRIVFAVGLQCWIGMMRCTGAETWTGETNLIGLVILWEQILVAVCVFGLRHRVVMAVSRIGPP